MKSYTLLKQHIKQSLLNQIRINTKAIKLDLSYSIASIAFILLFLYVSHSLQQAQYKT